MKFELTSNNNIGHNECVTSVVWSNDNTLLSVGDDKNIFRWINNNSNNNLIDNGANMYNKSNKNNKNNENLFAKLNNYYAVDMKLWYKPQGSHTSPDGHPIVIGSSDGKLRFINVNGNIERVVDAHKGAITCLKWNYEGTAIVTCGEDGCIKQWSQVGRLRSRLVQIDQCIYNISWSPDNQSVVYCNGKCLTIKSLAVNAKHIKWQAHDGIILNVDWNQNNNLIVSGGEDGIYKIWDSFGRQIYKSIALDYPITSLKWSLNGNLLAIGSYNLLLLANYSGWIYSRSPTNNTGSINTIDWTMDSTQIAIGTSNGNILFGQLTERSIEWNRYIVTLKKNNQLYVEDLLQEDSKEILDFTERVVEMSIGYNYLIIVTSKQCYIYNTNNFVTPHIFDLNATVFQILQSKRYFLLVDNINGCQIYSYEGRRVSIPRIPGIRPQWLRDDHISLSNDVIAIIDPNKRQIHLRDLESGKLVNNPIKHLENVDILNVAINQYGLINRRKIVYIDANRDLYMAKLNDQKPYKLSGMIDSVIWHSNDDILVAISDGNIVVWYYPSVVDIDADLLIKTRCNITVTGLNKHPRLINCYNSLCTAICNDGSLQTIRLSSFPAKLIKLCDQGQWIQAIRMCRRVAKTEEQNILWSCLAAISIEAQELETAELSLAALDEVDKVAFMRKIMAIPTREGRSAELLLYRGRGKDAESLLLQAGLIYRAIKLNLRLYHWRRAMELAIEHKTHVDVVLYYRQQYLTDFQRTEDIQVFIEYGKQIEINAETVMTKEAQELEREKSNGIPYQKRMNFQANDITNTINMNNNNNNLSLSSSLPPPSTTTTITSSTTFKPVISLNTPPPPLESLEPEVVDDMMFKVESVSKKPVARPSRRMASRHQQQEQEQPYEERRLNMNNNNDINMNVNEVNFDDNNNNNNNNNNNEEDEVEFAGETLF